MAIDWSVVTSEHVREAARQLDVVKLRGRSYPAKFIRGLAYEVATGRRLNPNTDFAGGKETARFLANLGFEVDYESRPASRQRLRQKSPRQPDPTDDAIANRGPLRRRTSTSDLKEAKTLLGEWRSDSLVSRIRVRVTDH